MVKTKLTVLSIFFFVVVLVSAPVWAQTGNPLIPLNEYGTPDMDLIDLTLTDAYSEPIVIGSLPLFGDVTINLSYDVYSDNYGNSWVVPDPFTILYTTIYPETIPDGLANSTGWAYGSLAMGIIDNLGGLEALNIDVGGVTINTDQELGAVLRDFIEMEGDHLGFMMELGKVLADADSTPLWQLSWVYDHNPFDPEDTDQLGTMAPPTPRPTRQRPPTRTPRPTPTPRPTATPMPTPITCPPESISQKPPVATILETFPPHPVVKGQGGQGLDVTVRAISYPVIHRWWTRERKWECKWWDVDTYGVPRPNNGNGCCPEDQQLQNGGCGVNTSDCWWVAGDWECVEHTEAIPDPILMEYFNVTALLRQTSVEWIQTDLASKYPGADIKHPNWYRQPDASPTILPNGVCIVEGVAHIPFEDPGWYDVSVNAQTAGTIYTPPRSFSYVMPTPQPVYLMDTMLIR